MIRAALLTLALLAAACTPVGEAGSAHPLAGRVWDVSGQRFIPMEEAVRRIAAADVALLGETHDNPGHHAIQLRILRAMLAAGRQPALAMEQIDTDRQGAVPYIGEYRLIQLPALIFLDAQRQLLWMAVGNVAKEDVAAKLTQFGG